jgi:hypothetical protein
VKFSLNDTRLSWPGVLFFVVFFSSAGVAGGSHKLKKSLTLDLPTQSRETSLRGPLGMQYVGPGAVAVWYTQKNQGQLSRRDKLDKDDPWRLDLQLVNLADGTVKQRSQWPTRKNSSDFAARQDGMSVLLTGPVVRCFSPDFRETNSFTLKSAEEPKEVRVLRNSPGGSVVWGIEASDSETATRVDPNSCAPGLTFNEPRSAATISGNDNQLVDINPTQVGIWSPESGFKLLYTHQCCLSNSLVVGPDLVGLITVSFGTDRHFLLINTRGELLLEDTLEPGMQFSHIVTSAGGETAAVVIAEREFADTETGIEIRRTHAKIRFYDLEKRKRIGDSDANIPGENLFWLAISPDSSEFALLNGTKLSIYELRR